MSNHHPDPASCPDKQELNNKENKQPTWGDTLKIYSSSSSQNIIRIVFQNINGFGYTDKHSKTDSIRSFIQKYKVDIMALVETNVNWKRVKKNRTIWDKTRHWFENQRVSVAYNSLDRSGKKYQPGGCSIITQGELALRSDKSGQDERRLGRWAWSSYVGKNRIKMRFISAYVPNKAKQYGVRKTYSQQQRVLLASGIKKDPIDVFWEDIWKAIDKWKEEGDQIIIGGDWNSDIRDEKFLQPFKERNLIPSITGRHGKDGPETYHRGSVPIDEIFVSSNISIFKCGYLNHGTNCSDHRAIWIDIKKISVLGSKLPNLPTYQARRLKCHDPRIVSKYLYELDEFMEKHNLYQRVKNLAASSTYPLSQHSKCEYEQIDILRCKGMIKAEKKCRKLKMGNIKWSPEVQQARDRIEYFKASLSKARGTKVSARFLIRLGQQCGANGRGMTINELEKATHNAYEEYKEVRKTHAERRESFINELAEAQSLKGNKKKEQILREMLHLEAQRSIFRRIKLINGGKQNLGTTFVEIEKPDGTIEQITNKKEMETAIIHENRKKYHQTENSCPFHVNPLRQDFGDFGEGPGSNAVAKGEYKIPKGIDEFTAAYITVCTQDPSIEEGAKSLFSRTQQEYEQSWSKMKEKTSSRELHFGHFKAGIQNNSISNIHYIMAEIPLRTGYSPERWQKATNVMILKKPVFIL